jgi:hypothetical protein
MNDTWRDKTMLDSLRPLEVAAYLRAGGWRELCSKPGSHAIWTKQGPDRKPFEVLLPLDRKFRDFSNRIANVVAVLAVAESRSQLELHHDLTTSAADIVRVRLRSSSTADGTVLLDDGVGLVLHCRNLIQAAACSAAKARPWYHTRTPRRAGEFMEEVRLGQTERGGYIVTLQTRVPPALVDSAPPDALLEFDEPFERRVTTTLAHALETTRTIAEDAFRRGSVDGFRDAVAVGVSANLCDAVAGLTRLSGDSAEVVVDFTWSRFRPQLAQVKNQMSIPSDAAPNLG